jgi:hypothetical protein
MVVAQFYSRIASRYLRPRFKRPYYFKKTLLDSHSVMIYIWARPYVHMHMQRF